MNKFGPERRIKKRTRFLEIQSKGRKIGSKNFILLFIKTEVDKPSRLGVTVSKKVSKSAVVRNKLRRRVKEIFRLEGLKTGLDLVVIAHQGALELNYEQIREELVKGFQKL